MARKVRTRIFHRDFSAPPLIAVQFVILWAVLLRFLPTQDNSDGLLQTIISLQKLTVYFWGQDRFGNLLPALTVWVHNPTYNAYAQLALRVLMGLLAPIFFCSLAFRHPIDAWRATLVTDCLFAIVIAPALSWEIYIEASPYGSSLTCCGLATLALHRAEVRKGPTWLLLTAGLLLIAYMVNFAQFLLAVPLIGLLAVIQRSVFMRRLLVAHLIAAVLGLLLPRMFASDYHTAFGATIISQNFERYLKVIWLNTHWPFVLITALPFIVLLASSRTQPTRQQRCVDATVAAMLLAVIAFFLAVASSQWLATNQFHQRYFIPGYLLLISIGGISLWQLSRNVARDSVNRGLLFACVATLLLLTATERLRELNMVTHGIIGDGKAPLAETVGRTSIAFELDGIAGDYWLVWPSVFMAEQYRYDQARWMPAILGITFRGDARRDEFTGRLAERGSLRIGCIDIEAAPCAGFASTFMAFPGLQGISFAPSQTLPDHHVLNLVTIRPP